MGLLVMQQPQYFLIIGDCMDAKAQINLIYEITNALANTTRLQIIDALKTSAKTPEALAEEIGVSVAEVMEQLTVLRKAGLLPENPEEGVEVFLSPFGIYGAREALKEFLGTTHEDGKCAGCNGCK